MELDSILTASVFASAIRLATPYIFAALGETFTQRSGILNLGVDGMMLMGAFTGFYAVFITQQEGTLSEPLSLLFGVLVALIVGGLMGLAMAFVSVTLKAKQGISGIGVYLFGLGLSELLFQQWVGTPKAVHGFPRITFPILSDIPVLGQIFFHHNLLVYVAFALVPISSFVLNRTTFGLMIRAVGQNPEAADAMGVSVAKVRYATTIIGGMLAGLGRSITVNRADQPVSAKPDRWPGFYRGRVGLFRRLASLGGGGRRLALQLCQCPAIADQGDWPGYPVGVRGHGSVCHYHCRPGFRLQTARTAHRLDQALRTWRIGASRSIESCAL